MPPQAANKARPEKEISQDAARAIMDDIRVLNGGLPEEDWERMSEKGKKSYINLQVLAGNGIMHVAKDLYDADARFIFELIQNADDNRYSTADHRNQLRFLHFTLYHDKIMVESNEDGFSEQDLRAICSIHQSTKELVSNQSSRLRTKSISNPVLFVFRWSTEKETPAWAWLLHPMCPAKTSPRLSRPA